MPHDKLFMRLQEGDIVIVECKVVKILEGDEFCNVTLDTVEPMHPSQSRTTISLNSRQVQIRPEDLPFDGKREREWHHDSERRIYELKKRITELEGTPERRGE